MNKKNMILLLILLLCSILAFALGTYIMLHEPKEKEEQLMPISEVSIEDNYTSAPGEYDTDIPLFVFNSKTDFAEECYGIDTHGKRVIDAKISKYLSKYVTVPKGECLYGDYVKGSYYDNGSTPSFKVDVELYDGSIVRLTCIYNNALQAYAIESTLNE